MKNAQWKYHTIEWRVLTMFTEVVSFNEEHQKCVKLFMSVDDSKKISWVSLCENLCSRVSGFKVDLSRVHTDSTYLSAGWKRSLSCS